MLQYSSLSFLDSDEGLDEFEDPDWIPIEVKTRILRIENFRLSDVGSYR